jgi:hypothetical protein
VETDKGEDPVVGVDMLEWWRCDDDGAEGTGDMAEAEWDDEVGRLMAVHWLSIGGAAPLPVEWSAGGGLRDGERALGGRR